MDLNVLGFDSWFEEAYGVFRSPGMIPGRIATASHGLYQVWTRMGTVPAQVSGRFEFTAVELTDYPVVGDWVVLQEPVDGGPGIIHHVMDRKTCLTRKAPGTIADIQPMAANVDTVFIVMGLDADYNLRRMERYLSLARECRCTPVIILNKSDICDDGDDREQSVRALAGNARVVRLSALDPGSADILHEMIAPGTTITFLGSSGVGKSTLINRLLNTEAAATGAVREYDGKGRHTTTRREMFLLDGGGILIDTPGMKELQLAPGTAGIESVYADIEALTEQCRFKDCSHNSEPGCAVRDALENGTLDSKRWSGYLKMIREDKHLKRQQDIKLARLDNLKWKNIARSIRERKKTDPKLKE